MNTKANLHISQNELLTARFDGACSRHTQSGTCEEALTADAPTFLKRRPAALQEKRRFEREGQQFTCLYRGGEFQRVGAVKLKARAPKGWRQLSGADVPLTGWGVET